MKTCKFPNCNKQLVGKEKFMCKSCTDKIKDGAKKTGLIISGAALTIVAVVVKFKNGDKA